MKKKGLNPEKECIKVSLKIDLKPEGGFKVEKKERSDQKCKCWVKNIPENRARMWV